MAEARAFWTVAPGRGELRAEPLPPLGAEQVLVQSLFSGVSRGTESLVFRGLVPASQHAAMRAPFQAGEFGLPVKYGYCSVGRVVEGPESLRGRRVFCLHPHQDRYVVPAAAVLPLPDGLPSQRAVLAANMETALNGLWDAGPRLGDRIAVIGAGVVGLLAASLAAGIPGAEVELIDTDPRKAAFAAALGLAFRSPADARGAVDLAIHASGTAAGLATALGLAGFEATVLELSWYGSRPVASPLGEAFHSRRLRLVASQVGTVAPRQRPRWRHRDRLALALRLLADDRYDELLAPPAPFDRLPAIMAELAAGGSAVMCQVIDYGAADG
jgi:threonine dehydrogenase-like Zn-dependent dehydrogenase